MLRGVLDRFVHFPARTVFAVLAIVLAVAAALQVIWISRHVIAWILISLFLVSRTRRRPDGDDE